MIECLILVASIRRSLFDEEECRLRHLENNIQIATDLLEKNAESHDQQTIYYICRLLLSIKSIYEVSELEKCEKYEQWKELILKFTLAGFRNGNVRIYRQACLNFLH